MFFLLALPCYCKCVGEQSFPVPLRLSCPSVCVCVSCAKHLTIEILYSHYAASIYTYYC